MWVLMTMLQKIAVGLGVAALVISISGLYYAAEQIDSTNLLLEQNTEQIGLLNSILLETENQVLQAELQTLSDAYRDGLPFDVKAKSCSFFDEKIVLLLDVQDKHSFPSTIKFEIIIDLVTYSVGGEVGNAFYAIINPQQLIFDPTSQKQIEVPLEEFFNLTNEIDDSELYLRTQYRFAPYFDRDGEVISEFVKDDKGDLLFGLEKNSISGNWTRIADNPNIVCL